jgi:hypothetical protein
MSSEETSFPIIQVAVGESFEIHLYSRGGSTGYLWYLSEMPKGVVLVSTAETPVGPSMPGSQTRQTFTFVATAEMKGPLSFELLRIWMPTEPADTRNYVVIADAADAESLEARMTAEAGSARFLRPEAFRAAIPPIMPYGVPTPGIKADECCKDSGIHILYGFPPPTLPGGQYLESVVESTNNCRVKYGVPWGVTDPDNCVLKYGFPGSCCDKPGPVLPLYGFPPDSPVEIIKADDDANCVVKYGMPNGVGKDDENCNLKYGMPKPKPDCKKC